MLILNCSSSTISRKVSKSPSPIEINGEQKYKMEKKIWLKNTKWLIVILHSLARLWCDQTHMGAN